MTRAEETEHCHQPQSSLAIPYPSVRCPGFVTRDIDVTQKLFLSSRIVCSTNGRRKSKLPGGGCALLGGTEQRDTGLGKGDFPTKLLPAGVQVRPKGVEFVVGSRGNCMCKGSEDRECSSVPQTELEAFLGDLTEQAECTWSCLCRVHVQQPSPSCLVQKPISALAATLEPA